MTILHLFPHLKGHKVLHESWGKESLETIERITRKGKDNHLVVEFKSGKFTSMLLGHFDYFLEKGEIQYLNWLDVTSIERLTDFA